MAAGQAGRLIADDGWHQARGRLVKGTEYDLAAVHYADSDEEAWGLDALRIGWTPLGRVDLPAGEHALQVECEPDAAGFGFDCWALIADHANPGQPAQSE